MSPVNAHPRPITVDETAGLPFSQREGVLLVHAIAELLVRVEVVEGALQALGTMLDASQVVGELPPPSPGLSFVQRRHAIAAETEATGESSLDRHVRLLREANERAAREVDEDLILRRVFRDEARKRGAFYTEDGVLHDWRPMVDSRGIPWDRDGKLRHAEALQAARERLAAAKKR